MFQKNGANIIASDGAGWDHVSVSMEYRCPSWEEMETVRGWFFEDEETVIQFSPPRNSERVNLHPHCLHMWRNQSQDVELPPTILVGPPTERQMTEDEREVVTRYLKEGA
jgi:hypothetical protein